MTEFVRFQEVNDHEGEVWNFWLQVDGNEAALDQLRAILAQHAEKISWEPEYTLGAEPISETEVDTLVAHARTGYLAYENKVTGTLILPAGLTGDTSDGLDALYKGGIEKTFTA